MSKVAIA